MMNHDGDGEDEILEAAYDANSDGGEEILDAEGVAHLGDGDLPLD